MTWLRRDLLAVKVVHAGAVALHDEAHDVGVGVDHLKVLELELNDRLARGGIEYSHAVDLRAQLACHRLVRVRKA